MKKNITISSIEKDFVSIVSHWINTLQENWADRQQAIQLESLSNQCSLILKALLQVMPDFQPSDKNWQPPQSSELVTYLNDIGELWAKKGFSSSETSNFILTLKNALIEHLQKQYPQVCEQLLLDIIMVEKLMDRLLMICQESYSNSREKLIRQQNKALLDLSTPVVKMWDSILLLPLIGVIDTTRAKKVTESLLYEITKEQAQVTVVDLTGVPIFDTAIAGHLMKTVNAAQMLGCSVILTGISPDGALVLTKLGIEFNNVLTRGNLNSGVAEAFRLVDLQVQQRKLAVA